jgi:enoyl-CoA hydratase/carnithine racemase
MGLTRLTRAGAVTLLGIDRPDKRNALDLALVEQLHADLVGLRDEPTVLVLHSTTPGTFVAGADIAELLERGSSAGLRGINAVLFDAIEAHPWPTIAAIDGPALGGGCELALACDLRLATPRARFAQPEPSLGIMAGAGGNWRLPQAVGLPRARRMLFTGATVGAEEALAIGLIDALHEPSELLDGATALGERIAQRSWRALQLTKAALRLHRPATTAFDAVAQALLFDDDDKRVRMHHFLDRRSR